MATVVAVLHGPNRRDGAVQAHVPTPLYPPSPQ